jgi:hypothetical protein
VRHTIVRAAVIAVLIGGAALAHAYSTGPPPTRTGGFAVAGKPAEINCTLCHWPTGSENSDPNGSLRIAGIPSQYAPGHSYALTVQLNYDWSKAPSDSMVKWGFQLTAVKATTGDSAGTFYTSKVAPDSIQTMHYPPASPSTYKRRAYFEHTYKDIHKGENEDGQSGPIEWHLTWVAPLDSAKVYFFVAGNAANGDSCSICGGDHIYTYQDSADGGAVASVPLPHGSGFVNFLEAPYPNPFTQCLNLQFEIARGGFVDLSIFDLQGRKVRNLVHERRVASSYGEFWNGRRDDGSQARNGIYFVRLSVPGQQKPLSRKIILSR